VATLSVLAIGKKHVEGVVMPSKFTSQKSLELADDLIKNLGIQKKILPINDSLEIVKNTFEKNNLKLESLANENAQARLRGLFLMSLANSENGLVLTTSNKTEMALGYSTLYGDMCGGLAPISDLSKQKVFELCYHINKTNKQTLIPEKIITRKPTAELRNNQTDEESLGLDYKTLSPLVDELIEKSNLINLQNLEKKYGKENVAKIQNLIQKSEFKRRQSPPGIKLTSKSFGLGRREPF
jgi:NAD+ synthase (glutamine-hydrolysing)